MIFLYPAVVTETVDQKLVPAVLKTLEQFYLAHILEAMSNNVLRVKSIYDTSKKNYGPLMLEAKREKGNVLTEADDPVTVAANIERLKAVSKTLEAAYVPFDTKSEDLQSGDTSTPEGALRQSQEYSHIANNALDLSAKLDGFIHDATLVLGGKDRTNNPYYDELNPLINSASENKKKLDTKIRSWQNSSAAFANQARISGNQLDLKDADSGLKQKETFGSYKVVDYGGISLVPSMANVNMKIHYVGGPHVDQDKPFGDSGDTHELAVGVKCLPLLLKNFQTIENALLDDYFSNTAERIFKNVWRGSVRKVLRIAERVIFRIFNKQVDFLSKVQDPAKQLILYAPSAGAVNASSFKRRANTPAFYNYSSSVVIFNKDDIEYEAGRNFFENPQQLAKMFKMGWNAFCIMDPANEEMLFYTSVDGGLVHKLPYPYLLGSLKLGDRVYDGLDDLKRRSAMFRLRPIGRSARNLSSKLRKESLWYESIKRMEPDA